MSQWSVWWPNQLLFLTRSISHSKSTAQSQRTDQGHWWLIPKPLSLSKDLHKTQTQACVSMSYPVPMFKRKRDKIWFGRVGQVLFSACWPWIWKTSINLGQKALCISWQQIHRPVGVRFTYLYVYLEFLCQPFFLHKIRQIEILYKVGYKGAMQN